MSLGSALATAMSGLRANQAALSIASSNIANAQTPGYITQSTIQVETVTGDIGTSVNVLGVNRQLNQFIQTQLRTESSGIGPERSVAVYPKDYKGAAPRPQLPSRPMSRSRR